MDQIPVDATESRRRKAMWFLGLAVAGAQFTMAVQMGLNANFLKEDIGVTGGELGRLEAARESCGIIALGVLALLAGFAEPIVGSGMLMLLAVGIGAYAFVPNYPWVVGMSLVWSQGLHVWMPLPNSMTLALAEPGRAGHRLGQIQASGAAGFGVGIGAAWLLTLAGVAMRPMYVLAAGTAVIAAAACLGIPRQLKTPGPRLVFRSRYGLYYLLCFLEGWRKQMSLCFAGYLLVKVYGTQLKTMLLLWAIVQGIGYFAAPRVGRLIDRIGERKILIFYYASMTACFVGYALVPNKWVLYVLFVADNAFFVFNTALTTYVNRIVPPSEHTPTLSMGVAMNHVAAVMMPFVGGLLWDTMGYRWAFALGALAAAASIIPSLLVPRHVPHTLPAAQPAYAPGMGNPPGNEL
jgi:MFS family permease